MQRETAPSHRARFVAGLQATVAASVLVTAAVLHPDARGFGTHEQLGLPPCSFTARTGLPCPGCGLTTSICDVVHGRFGPAMHAHGAGVPAAMWLLWLVLVGAAQCTGKRWPSGALRARIGVVLACCIVVAGAATWLARF